MEGARKLGKAIFGSRRRAWMMGAFVLSTLIAAVCLPGKADAAWLRWLFTGLILLLGLAAIRFATGQWNLARSFLIIALLFGIIMAFVTPAMSGPDEATHFARAYATSEGQLFPHGKVKTPADFFLTSRKLGMETQTGNAFYETVQGLGWDSTDISATGGYSFLGYIPMAAGILIAKLFGTSAIGYLYMGRIVNLIAYALLAWAAIRITPKLKATFFITALLPMPIYLAANFSIDGILLGLVLVSAALFIKLWNAEDGSARIKDMILLSIPILLAAVVKFFFIGPFLLLIVPRRVFKDRKGAISRYWLFALLLAITIAWQLYAMRMETARTPAVPGADAGAQIAYILSHPLQYLRMLGETFISRLNNYVMMLGTVGKLNLTLNIIATASPILAVLIYALDGMERELNRGRKAAILALILVMTAFIFTALYLDWTPVGARVAEGVQGRYFLPLLPLIALLIHIRSVKIDKEKLGHIAQAGGFFIIAGTAVMMVMSYY